MTVKGRKPIPTQDLAASPIEKDSTVESSDVCFLHGEPTHSSGTQECNVKNPYPIMDAIVCSVVK